jgi:hypothetical protein
MAIRAIRRIDLAVAIGLAAVVSWVALGPTRPSSDLPGSVRASF